jgi:hypothetical protein
MCVCVHAYMYKYTHMHTYIPAHESSRIGAIIHVYQVNALWNRPAQIRHIIVSTVQYTISVSVNEVCVCAYVYAHVCLYVSVTYLSPLLTILSTNVCHLCGNLELWWQACGDCCYKVFPQTPYSNGKIAWLPKFCRQLRYKQHCMCIKSAEFTEDE